MNTPDLSSIARRTRFMREATVALVLCGIVLAGFAFLPAKQAHGDTATVVLATSTTPSAFANLPPLTAKAAIVYDLKTHKMLFGKNPNAQLPLASLTKLLTMYAAFSEFSSSTPITIPQDVMGLSEPHAFLPGEKLALGALARITLTASLNDGAAAIAQTTAGYEHTTIHNLFQKQVTDKLGLTETYANNGNGLDISKEISGGYGSPHDLAILAGAFQALAPGIASATTHETASANALTGQHFVVHNTDHVVTNIPGLLLSKTGYTDLAGGNLVLVFDVGLNHRIAVVVLGSTLKARFTDGMALVDATLAHFAHEPSL